MDTEFLHDNPCRDFFTQKQSLMKLEKMKLAMMGGKETGIDGPKKR